MRTNRITASIIAIFLCLFSVSTVFGWNSLFYYTHEALADDAIHVLEESEYPDLYKYAEKLKDGSESELPHGGYIYNGGNVENWWSDKARSSFMLLNFVTAYEQIGEIAHLTQDQAVPAHSANILHGPGILLDLFEEYADDHYVKNPKNGYSYELPHQYYQKTQDDTRQKLNSWKHPESGKQYWVPAPDAPSIGQDATAQNAPRGYYGGDFGFDIFDGEKDPTIISTQIEMATKYTAGVFAAASKSLPPISKDLIISGNPADIPVIDLKNGNQISFKILENRKPVVKVFMTVDSSSGDPIISSDFGTGRSYGLSTGSVLPYEGTFTITWNGTLANGKDLTDGEHTLYVVVQDYDENPSIELTHKFKIESGPTVTQTDPADGIYNVPVDSTISITFDHEMSVDSVESAITVFPDFAKTVSGSGKSVSITPKDMLAPSTDYVVTISDIAMDVNGSPLDGDKDGSPGGNYTFTFSTKPAKIKVTYMQTDYQEGETHWVKDGAKSVSAQLVDDSGNAILSKTPPKVYWVAKGVKHAITFPSASSPQTEWISC